MATTTHQFHVPQFIDVEDKILGPITTRQFVICLLAFGLEFVLYKLFTFWVFAFLGLLLFAFAGTVAFLRVNGRPFHYFLLNLTQTMRRPRLQVWDKSLSNADVRRFLREVPPAPPPAPPTKAPIESTRLQELALVVNTGGVYRPES